MIYIVIVIYNFSYRDIRFWSYRPTLQEVTITRAERIWHCILRNWNWPQQCLHIIDFNDSLRKWIEPTRKWGRFKKYFFLDILGFLRNQWALNTLGRRCERHFCFLKPLLIESQWSCHIWQTPFNTKHVLWIKDLQAKASVLQSELSFSAI